VCVCVQRFTTRKEKPNIKQHQLIKKHQIRSP